MVTQALKRLEKRLGLLLVATAALREHPGARARQIETRNVVRTVAILADRQMLAILGLAGGVDAHGKRFLDAVVALAAGVRKVGAVDRRARVRGRQLTV